MLLKKWGSRCVLGGREEPPENPNFPENPFQWRSEFRRLTTPPPTPSHHNHHHPSPPPLNSRNLRRLSHTRSNLPRPATGARPHHRGTQAHLLQPGCQQPDYSAATALVTILIVRATLYLSQTPDFIVTDIQSRDFEQKNNSHDEGKSSEFRIWIQVRNQNTRLSVSYKEGGGAFLDFNDKRIEQGKVPTVIEDGSGAVHFAVVVAANAVAIGAEMKKSLKEEREKVMKLKMG